MGGGITATEVRHNMRQLSKWFLLQGQLLPVCVLVDCQGYTSVRVTGELEVSGRPAGGKAEVGGGRDGSVQQNKAQQPHSEYQTHPL